MEQIKAKAVLHNHTFAFQKQNTKYVTAFKSFPQENFSLQHTLSVIELRHHFLNAGHISEMELTFFFIFDCQITLYKYGIEDLFPLREETSEKYDRIQTRVVLKFAEYIDL